MYSPPLPPAVQVTVESARRWLAESDAVDRRLGCTVVSERPLYEHLRAALEALAGALARADWEAAAEAYCRVQDAEVRARKLGGSDGNDD